MKPGGLRMSSTNDLIVHKLSRRTLLGRFAFAGVVVSSFGGLLAECGEDDGDTVDVGAETSDDDEPIEEDTATDDSEDVDSEEDDTDDAVGPVSGGHLAEGSGGVEPDTLDPHLSGYQNTAALAVHFTDSLVRHDGEFELWPNLAESWDVDDSAMTYTFDLKGGVTFHDDTPFNADSVKYNFDRIVDPATASRMAVGFLGPYVETEVIDEQTVTVHFSDPFPFFLESAARSLLGFLSPTALEEFGEDIGRNPVGTGYFKFEEWDANKHIRFSRNENYDWGPPVWQHTGPAHLESYTMVVLADPATALAAFDNNEVQMTNVPAIEVDRYMDNPNATVLRRVFAGFPRSVFMNVTKPPTDDLLVRQACIWATDPNTIIQISLGGQVEPAHGPLASTTPGYDPTVEDLYGYDPDRARELLDEAGWVEGSGEFREKDGEVLTMTCIVNDGWDGYVIPLQAMWREVGIDMRIETVSSAARVEMNTRGEGNLAPLGADSSDPRILEITFHSRSLEDGWAWSRYGGDELDELLDSAAREPDEDLRNEMYSRIQHIIMEEALIVPLVENTYFRALSLEVEGVAIDAQGYAWLYDTTITEGE
jgi:peptide/nickel transport system substrate-binding protein